MAADDHGPIPPRRPVVMADVARRAGVSIQTVSRVVNGSPNIRASTKDRVERAVRDLGYRPNHLARALVTRRSRIIGIITTAAGQYGPASIHRNLEDAARAAGFFAGSVGLEAATGDSLAKAIEHLMRQSVEGIVMVTGQAAALDLVRSQGLDVPLVVVEGDLSRSALAVGVDQHRGAYDATRHLLDLGHRRIAHVAGPPDWTEATARMQGWRDALTEAGLSPAPAVVGDWTAASGYRAGRELARDHSITAVFVANDQMALGVLRALHEAGRPAPGDVSVIGFDDIPEAAYLIPPLSTVRQDFAEVGRRAIAVLAAAIAGSRTEPAGLVQPTLVPRASTGPVADRTPRG
ncbi:MULTISPECIES: LacI family DNA-binding transcriptional regulator [unclassified Nocardioides]|uniref:LacI family DNA-binding transcriptional regulator n=1 Tax=unclassified Nocardioides TaxID=2615069 RepID=UPI0009F0098A|nr:MULTISPECIES: LacI family DNA-binding transcriptional regulator [unclassified Nocardioides]GAW50929.1 Ribose operon repressor, LacI family [Nocardioides sp. PD653-B2]GAW56344.1 Ribose operon repressor, LacI family [Nocardioides sp. PD653]